MWGFQRWQGQGPNDTACVASTPAPLFRTRTGQPIYMHIPAYCTYGDSEMIKLNVPDMSCGHCVGTITEAIHKVDPAATVKTDLAAKTVTVETSQPVSAIARVVDDAGYPNSPAA